MHVNPLGGARGLRRCGVAYETISTRQIVEWSVGRVNHYPPLIWFPCLLVFGGFPSVWDWWSSLVVLRLIVMFVAVSLAGSMLIAPVRYGKTPLPLFSEVGLGVAHG